MKAIIIGGGSIGQRHSRNLNDMGISTRIVDVDEIDNIDSILKENFDIGLVCTPNILHVDHCLKLAENNIHIFCEKPFYTNRKNIGEILGIIGRKKVITMVGCNLRFTPEVQSIDPDTKYINVYFGYNLKKWRPGTNHLNSYSANTDLGGGILLDAIHELDYLYYRFGKIKNISYLKHKLTDITNDTEDLVEGTILFENGTNATFHLNYLSDSYERYFDVLEADTLKRVTFQISNQMYVDEIKYFVDCVKNGKQCMNSFEEASYLLENILDE